MLTTRFGGQCVIDQKTVVDVSKLKQQRIDVLLRLQQSVIDNAVNEWHGWDGEATLNVRLRVFCIAEHNKLPAYTWKNDIDLHDRDDVPNSKL